MNASKATRFVKGRSGNPGGRPRKIPEFASAFDILLDRSLTITQGGLTRDMTVEEALQHKIYEQAVAGKRMAVRKLLKMIVKREKALAEKAPPAAPIRLLYEPNDPTNAYEALCILKIAIPDPRWNEQHNENRLLLEPWAVRAALGRRGLSALSAKNIAEIERCTSKPEQLSWPRKFKV